MKNIKYFAWIAVFVLSSCYVYKPFGEGKTDETTENMRTSKPNTTSLSDSRRSSAEDRRATREKDAEKEKEIQRQKEAGVVGLEDADAKMKELEKLKEEEEKRKEGRMTATENPVLLKDNGAGGQLKKKQKEANVVEPGVKGKLQPNKYYKISVEEKQYKIQVDKWEGDTLRAHVIRQPKKELSFHENQIDEEKMLERRFSKPYSDIFTVGAYVVGGAAVLLLFL